MRLSIRILLGYFLIVGLAGASILWIVVEQIKPSVRESIEEVMIDTANLLAEVAARDFRDGKFADEEFGAAMRSFTKREVNAKIWHFVKSSLDMDVYITDPNGVVIFDSSGDALGKDFSQWRNVKRTLRGEYGARSTLSDYDGKTSTVFHVSAPIYAPQTPAAASTRVLLGSLTVFKPTETLAPIVAKAERTILVQGSFLILVALALGALLTWRLNLGISKLLIFAEKAAAGDTAEPPSIHTTELRWLAQAMAKMRDELRGKRYMEQYTQGLAHELKSPLSAIGASTEFLADNNLSALDRQRFVQLSTEQIAKMRNSIEQMLSAARMDNMVRADAKIQTNLSRLIYVCVREAATLLKSKGLRVEHDANDISAEIDPALISLAISNLLSNAIDFSNSDSVIEITVRQTQTSVDLIVKDYGVGLSELGSRHLFERFFSLPRPNGKKGSGLGLYLVKQVARLHGGQIDIANHAKNGVLATLSLPRSSKNHTFLTAL